MAVSSISTEEVFRIEEGFGAGPRALLGLVGLVPLLAPLELLVRPGIAVSEAAILLPWLVSAGAFAVGLPLLGVALLGIRRTVTVDMRDGLLSERVQGAFRLTWTRSQALARVAELGVEPEAWSDGSGAWWVVVRFEDETHPWHLTRCAAREDAMAVARDVASRSHLPLSK